MKRLVSLLLVLFLFCGIGTTAYAAGESPPEETITDTGPGAEDEVTVVKAAAVTEQPASIVFQDVVPSIPPIEVRMETLGDVPYITRTYEITQGEDMASALAQLDAYVGFAQDGYRFTRHDSYSRTLPGSTDSRVETVSQALPLDSDDATAVLALAEPYVGYNEGGYTGQLALDTGSIHITEAGSESYSYRVTDVREYANLDRQDAAYIPKTVQKNGMTLSLENVEWIVMGTTPTADGLVPNLFKAVATYSAGATGSRVSGYTATFRYTGTVEKSTPGSMLVSIVFRGEEIVLPEPEAGIPVLPVLACVLGGLLVLALGTAAFLTRSRWCGRTVSASSPQATKPLRGGTPKSEVLDVEKIRLAAEAQYDSDSKEYIDSGYAQEVDEDEEESYYGGYDDEDDDD